ncbi:armadillo repeat-containing protein 10 [Ambystoma mexicanum]|uniref:armadillo repeat-containing protein 10 n=1 Tax=Ambystoma mexicanum TaxID=8296 RepID=UPI0037E9C311
MGRSSRGSFIRALLGLAVGGGALYWLYRQLFNEKSKKRTPLEQDGAGDMSMPPVEAASGLLHRVAGMAVVPSVHRRPADVLINPSSNLDAEHLHKLIELLETTDESSIREQALVTLSNSAAFSVNQELIRNFGGIFIIGKLLSDPSPEVKVQALNALNNLGMNVRNQEQIKVYIGEICTDLDVAPLNSELQLAALRVLTNMSVTNEYHGAMVQSTPCFLRVLAHGNENAQIHVLKVLVNMSANRSVMEDLLHAQAPSSLASFFDTCRNDDVLLRALTFVANVNGNMVDEESAAGHRQYPEGSLFSVLFGASKQKMQKLTPFLQHQDQDVKRQIARILTTVDIVEE